MEQYLVQHALRNVWGNPEQDDQLVIAAKRITPVNGSLNRFQLMNRAVDLPIAGKRYHVFNVGQLSPARLGFYSNKPSWVTESWLNMAESVEQNKIMVSVYTVDGTCIPRFQTFLLFSNERDLVIAVEDNPKLKINYSTDQVYFRVYSNAYYESAEAASTSELMRCKGRIPGTTSDIMAMQSEVAALRQLPGYVVCFCNGFLVDDLSPVTVQIGDSMEYVYDVSVKRVMTFDVGSLNTFTSDLDAAMKYLLHYPGAGDDTIDYQDDIDIYIVYRNANNRDKGYYYHRNTQMSHRMVTHKDYALVVDYFGFIAGKLIEDLGLSDPVQIQQLKVLMIVRKSGTNEPLIFDNSRIFEMYKLTDDKVLQAMMGVNSTLDLWKAQNLENNAYTQLMRAPLVTDVTLDLVQRAYGYNSISKIVGDTPQKTTLISGRQTTSLPEVLVGNCTVYEYDANGYLLGWHYHTGDVTYQTQDNNCRLIEAISGQGTATPDSIFGTNNLPVPAYDNYRVYQCWLENGVPNNQWRDVTGTSEYHIDNGILIWDNAQIDQFLMIRTDRTFLAYDIDVPVTNGNLFFTLAEFEDRGDGVQSYTMPVPTGDIDLIMNNKSLIKGLDYIVKFPMVQVVNKKYLVQPADSTPQHFHVRMTGFCHDDLTFDQIEDVGFIEFGYLSENNRYDIRDDKVMRMTVDGKTMHRDDLVFSEDHDGVSVADPTNGSPYQIKDIVVPLKQLVNENTYSLRAKSQAIDVQVSNYMTIKDPEPDRGSLTIIPEKYPVVSTFISRIVDAMLSGEITPIQIQTANSDNQVLALCQPYEGLLDFDPINEELGYDYNYVAVLPHRNANTVALTLAQYRFLTKVNNLYGQGLIILSPFFTVN